MTHHHPLINHSWTAWRLHQFFAAPAQHHCGWSWTCLEVVKISGSDPFGRSAWMIVVLQRSLLRVGIMWARNRPNCEKTDIKIHKGQFSNIAMELLSWNVLVWIWQGFEVVFSRPSHTEFVSIPWVYGQLVTSEPAQQMERRPFSWQTSWYKFLKRGCWLSLRILTPHIWIALLIPSLE